MEDGSLAGELAAALDSPLREALGHPTRRDVLRLLHADRRPRSFAEVSGELRPLDSAEVDYHVRVLESAGCVAVEGTRPSPRGGERLLRSAIAGDDQVRLVLRATQKPDRAHRQRDGRSENVLAMFRIPRPGRTIKLRGRRGPKGASR